MPDIHLKVDYQQRLSRARASMNSAGAEALALWPSSNMKYLTGYAPVTEERLILLIVTGDGEFLVIPRIAEHEARRRINAELFIWDDEEGHLGALVKAVQASRLAGVSKILVDDTMRAGFLLALQQAVPGAQYASAQEVISPLRARKDPAEIELLRQSAHVADLAMQVAIDACGAGVEEREVASALERRFIEEGVESVDFRIVGSGPNGAIPHHEAGIRRIERGDPVVIDIGATLNDYHSDITRTIVAGKPNPTFLEVYEVVAAAQARGIHATRAGRSCSELDAAVREVIEGSGYGPQFIHRTGHGLGLDVHEAPWLGPAHRDRIEDSMVFSIEPGVYLPSEFGVRIEDIVVAREGGCENLTGFTHELIQVE